MKLVGLLDSPYVRRVAIALHLWQLPFEHEFLSVFRNVEAFSEINPLVKAPSLVCDDGEVLMDSSLILTYLAHLAGPEQTLIPNETKALQRSLRLTGLGLNAMDKTVQIEYERNYCPLNKGEEPWRDSRGENWPERIKQQMQTAYDLLEPYAEQSDGWLITPEQITLADITVCVAWRFTQFLFPDLIETSQYPALATLSKKAEALPAFQATPLEPH